MTDTDHDEFDGMTIERLKPGDPGWQRLEELRLATNRQRNVLAATRDRIMYPASECDTARAVPLRDPLEVLAERDAAPGYPEAEG
jgi:hypothetical protein